MKIAILGYSGSGKSTLARSLGELYGVPVLHLDAVQFLPGWEKRTQDEQLAIVRDFMDSHEGWVIDGNYANLLQERRLAEADKVVFLLFNRVSSLWRVVKRYRRWRGRSRPDVTEGCREKLDAEFLWWILRRGRTKDRREAFERKIKACGGKSAVLKSQRQIDRWLSDLKGEASCRKSMNF